MLPLRAEPNDAELRLLLLRAELYDPMEAKLLILLLRAEANDTELRLLLLRDDP